MLELRDTKQTYGNKLVEMAERYPQLVVMEADLGKASGSQPFMERYPNRYYNVGIAEQNLVSMAAGMAAVGKIPFAATFACFLSQRGCDQVVTSVAYNKENVKLIGTYAGLTSEKNGGTHISVADISIMRTIPRMTVIDPGDALELEQAMEAAAKYDGPVYIRTNKGKFPVLHASDYQFQIGKAQVLSEGTDVGLITTGMTTWEGIQAVEAAKKKGIHVYHVHMPTIKPLDKEAVAACMQATGTIITVENHSVIGGLGGAVAEAAAETVPGKIVRLGLQDCFGETATLDYMMDKFGVNAPHILQALENAVK